MYLARGSSVEAYLAAAGSAGYGICVEALAVVVVDDIYAFAGEDTGCLKQEAVNGDAADIIQIGLRDGDAMDFGFEHLHLYHGR